MKAVNLIPGDAPGAAPGGRTGGAAYALLAVLGLLVVMATAWAWTGHTVKDKEAQAEQIKSAVAATEAKTGDLKTYTEFAELSQKRAQTVRQLAHSRFDWPHAMRDVARTIPSSAWITSLRATVSQNVTVDGTADPLRASIAAPAIEVAGCARTQADVARTMAAMRRIDDVQRVSLSSSAEADSGDSGSCGEGLKAHQPEFSLTVFFNSPTGAAAQAATAAAGATGGTTP